MTRLNHLRLLPIIGALVAVLSAPVLEAGDERPIIPSFASAIVRQVWDDRGDLTSSYVRDSGELTLKVQPRQLRPESGWAGVCVQNGSPVNLENFSHASAVLESSARVVMDIKLERTRFNEGTILLADHGMVGAGRNALEWNLRGSDEIGAGTLAQVRRMCFYVLADEYPARAKDVTVKITGVRFDRRGR